MLLFILGFCVMVGGAIKEWVTLGSGIAIVALGLASISVGIGLISVSAAYKSDKQKEIAEESGDSVTKKGNTDSLDEGLTRESEQSCTDYVGENGLNKTDIEIIKLRLEEIDQKLDRIGSKQWVNNLYFIVIASGLSSMLAGISLLPSSSESVFYGWLLAIAGLVVILVSSVAIVVCQNRFKSRVFFSSVLFVMIAGIVLIALDICRFCGGSLLVLGCLAVTVFFIWQLIQYKKTPSK